jgi:DNA-binding response OmpR family regulator
LDLFEAGVDDCGHEPFFASESTVRLGLFIRLRQAASNLSASDAVDVLRFGELELDLVKRREATQGTRPPHDRYRLLGRFERLCCPLELWLGFLLLPTVDS